MAFEPSNMTLESHLRVIAENIIDEGCGDVPLDYFSWGRDPRHIVDDTESLPVEPRKARSVRQKIRKSLSVFKKGGKGIDDVIARYRKRYSSFDETYGLMSDNYSRGLFVELILMKLLSEERMRLRSFKQSFIDSYEKSSAEILDASEELVVYKWVLKKINLENPPVSFFTVPTLLNLHYTGRLYRYCRDEVRIEVEGGDVVLDAGVGWGDTTVYLAALANQLPGGASYAFDILQEGMDALNVQLGLNPELDNVTPVLRALSNSNDEVVRISSPGPDATVVKDDAGVAEIKTVSIDSFIQQKNLDKIDFIKMDIEGSEALALLGGTKAIKEHKPKLAISVYHKWDDLLVIPKLIYSIRDDYKYYLDCTTGFGGEVVLYCI